MAAEDAQIILVTGTMFSGKSTELIQILNRFEHSDYKVQTFKPIIDDRYGVTHATSHDGLKREVIPVSGMEQLLSELKKDTEVIGIDEVQFLEDTVIDFAEQYANRGGILVASGLLKDYQDKVFPFRSSIPNQTPRTMMDFVKISDSIIQQKALCKYKEVGAGRNCGREATRVQLYIDGKLAPPDAFSVKIGGAESYSPRCRKHFQFYD